MMNWNNNDTKYIIKKILIYLIISGIIFFAGQRCVKAYSMVGYNADGGTNVTYSNNPPGLGGNPWLIDYGLYASSNNISGRYITVVADMSMNVTSLTNYVSYINTARDTLKASNLRCGIGTNFKTGYENTYTPTVENFNVYYSRNTNTGVSTIRLQFIYKQQRTFNNYSSTNYSCWFERSPIDGLYAQAFSTATYPVYIDFVGYNVSFSLSEDPNTALLQEQNRLIEIQNQIEQQQLQAINSSIQAINSVTGTINEPYNQQTGTNYLNVFNNLFTQQDENVIRQFVMIPFNLYVLLYNSITNGSCQSISLGTLYGVNLELPCINYRDIIGVPLYTTIDTIMGACLLFGIVRMIKKFFNSLFSVSSKATDENGIEVFK